MIHNLIISSIMGRSNWFLAGAFIGGAQILNQVYENECLKETVAKELQTSNRIKSFVSLGSLAEF